MSGVLPLLLAAQVGLSGVRSAEACSGGGPGEDFDEVGVYAGDITRVSVATDGFVLLRRSYYGELDPKDPGAWVRVDDADGAVVAGKVEVLLTRELGDVTERYLGWRANEPVPVGDVLRLTSWRSEAESAEAEGNSIELEVVGEPTPLPTPTVAIKKWGEVAHGVGERTECETWTTCGDSVASVPSREVRLVSVETTWTPPTTDAIVAWEVWAEASDPENGTPLGETSSRDVSLPSRSVVISGEGLGAIGTGIVAFAQDATDHCVVVVAKDLRTGEERRSEPLCEPDGEPRFMLRDHDLGECTDPPNEEALPLWCDQHGDDPRCPAGGGGQGGQGGQGGEASVDEPKPEAGEAGAGGSAGGAPSGSDGGCQVAPARSSFMLAIATLGAAAAWMRRRRAAR